MTLGILNPQQSCWAFSKLALPLFCSLFFTQLAAQIPGQPGSQGDDGQDTSRKFTAAPLPPVKWAYSLQQALAQPQQITHVLIKGGTLLPDQAVKLVSLPHLRELRLQSVKLTDINFVAELGSLEAIKIKKCNLQDLGPMANLTKLKRLSLDYNRIADLKPLTGLTGLQRLTLYHNRVRDVSPLTGLKSLKVLDLSENWLQSIAPLKNLVELQSLSLFRNDSIKDFTPLQALSGLRLLNVSLLSPEHFHIKAIAHLTKLTTLRAQGALANAEDLQVLGKMTELRSLNIGQNPTLLELNGLKTLTKLRSLDAHDCSLISIEPIKGCVELQKLFLNYNEITDLAPIANCKKLTILECANNPIKDFNVLLGLPQLKRLVLPVKQKDTEEMKVLLAKLPKACKVRFQ